MKSYRPAFKIFSSILWGLGLAAVFSKICQTKNCVIVKGIHPDKIKDKVFEKPEDHFSKDQNSNINQDGCYKLVEEQTECEEQSLSV